MAADGPTTRSLGAALAALVVVTAVWSGWAVDARATTGARLTADEPQYLLTAMSLWEDRSLDIADEIAAERYRAFHEVRLDPQTAPAADGSELSPHDPGLPLLLAAPMGLGGWRAARWTLSALAGVLAGVLAWTAVRRFAVPVVPAVVVVGACCWSPPLIAYGTQVYPELPAALVVAIALAALTGPASWRSRALVAACVIALPWLGVKYAPVAAVLGGWPLLADARSGRVRRAAGLAAALAAGAVAYLVAHRVLYGGWTVYAVGDHFTGGELDVVGTRADPLGRSRRLVGLLVDAPFGLAAWAPLWLAAAPAAGRLVARRTQGTALLGAVIAAGWATATWVALTMHGWWWPGRQVVVVLPAVVLVLASAIGSLAPVWRTRATATAMVLGLLGASGWGWLVAEVHRGERALVTTFEGTGFWPWRAWWVLLPDGRAGEDVLLVAWTVAVVGLGWLGWRASSGGADQDALAREGADADVLAVDLDGGGAVR